MTETDHSYYIEAVVKALESAGLTIADWEALEQHVDDQPREAYIELAPDTDGDNVTLTWDDERGWQWGWVDPEHRDKGIQCLTKLPRAHGHVDDVARPSVVVAALIIEARLDRLLGAEIPDDLDSALAAYLPEPAAEPTVVDLPLPKPEVIEP